MPTHSDGRLKVLVLTEGPIYLIFCQPRSIMGGGGSGSVRAGSCLWDLLKNIWRTVFDFCVWRATLWIFNNCLLKTVHNW